MVGLPKSIIKEYGISKKAWQVYRNRKKKKKGSSRSVSRTGKKNRRRRSFLSTSTLFKFVRIGALAVPAAYEVMSHPNDPQGMANGISQDYFGVDLNDGSFKLERLARGWMPFLAATLITYGIPKLTGIIRRL